MPALDCKPRSSRMKTTTHVIREKNVCKSKAVKSGKLRSKKIFTLIAALVLIFAYITLHASITKTGFDKSDLEKKIDLARIENQRLRIQWNRLSSPARVDVAAQNMGMVYATKREHLTNARTVAKL